MSHTGELPYKCEYCDQKYKTFNLRKRHVETIHLQIKSHKCEKCEKSFYSKTNLKKHLKIHEDY